MKKHSAGAKRRRAQAPAASVDELLTRMKMNPENFIFGGFLFDLLRVVVSLLLMSVTESA
jgi:hypothetical protein